RTRARRWRRPPRGGSPATPAGRTASVETAPGRGCEAGRTGPRDVPRRPVPVHSPLWSGGYDVRVNRAGAAHPRCLLRGREHMVIDPDDHRDEDQRVVDEVELHARDEELRDADRDGRVEEVLPDQCLALQKRVLDVVPELDAEGDHPPGAGTAHETRAEHPDAD